MSGARAALPPSRSRWDAAAARRWERAAADPRLGARVYTARLLGADPALVVAGGGNCSAKSVWTDALGERRAVLWIKGSGADLAGIDAGGFVPLDLEPARRLVDLERLEDRDLMRELRRLRLDPDAPVPSVETLLHALLPARFVDHTHADAVLAITNTEDGASRIREIYGDQVVVIPYVMPGFDLARLCAEQFPAESTAATIGMVCHLTAQVCDGGALWRVCSGCRGGGKLPRPACLKVVFGLLHEL